MSQDESNNEPNGKRTLARFQSLFVLVGVALIIVGLNNERPLVIVGAVLIGLAVFSSRRT